MVAKRPADALARRFTLSQNGYGNQPEQMQQITVGQMQIKKKAWQSMKTSLHEVPISSNKTQIRIIESLLDQTRGASYSESSDPERLLIARVANLTGEL